MGSCPFGIRCKYSHDLGRPNQNRKYRIIVQVFLHDVHTYYPSYKFIIKNLFWCENSYLEIVYRFANSEINSSAPVNGVELNSVPRQPTRSPTNSETRTLTRRVPYPPVPRLGPSDIFKLTYITRKFKATFVPI
jgi:hypothetical protein